jgi:hypothetical protein
MTPTNVNLALNAGQSCLDFISDMWILYAEFSCYPKFMKFNFSPFSALPAKNYERKLVSKPQHCFLGIKHKHEVSKVVPVRN